MGYVDDKTIMNLCIYTARKLVTIPKLSNYKKGKNKNPEYKHSKEIKDKISEQELRICFYLTLERTGRNFLYSLERNLLLININSLPKRNDLLRLWVDQVIMT
jgi:hypothetical protein